MDKLLRTQIVNEVSQSVALATETYKEEWVNGDQLIALFGMFTKGWLKTYGHLLPRTRAEVTEQDGRKRTTAWAYPRHKIARMVANNEIKHLTLKNCIRLSP